MVGLRCLIAKQDTPSVPVVPPDFDGLLRMLPPQVCCTLLPAMGFEPFLSQSPSRHISVTVGPLCRSRTRPSYPPKPFPPQQPHCVTTTVSFSPLLPNSVSRTWLLGLKALLRYRVRCHWSSLRTTVGPMLPWALFPFKVLPSYSNATVKSSGALPPRRNHSGPHPPKRTRPGLLSSKRERSMNKHAHPNGCTANAASRDAKGAEAFPPAGLPTKCQPALELFERPLLCFSDLMCRLRRSPALLLPTLQRSFRYEVALISRVFSARDRSPLTSCQAAFFRTQAEARYW
jgi:hypothetical protein